MYRQWKEKYGGVAIRRLARAVPAVCAGLLCVVSVVAITGTQHNIAWYKAAFVAVVWLISIVILYVGLSKARKALLRYEKQILAGLCLLWAICLYGVSCFVRSAPMTDYQNVWEGAMGLAYGGEVRWTYFALWKNNFPLFLLLSGLIRVSRFIGIEDPFYFLLLFAVSFTVWAGICVYRVLRLTEASVPVCFLGLFLFMGFVPLWGGTQYFYTDTMSLCFGIWSVQVLLRALVKKRSSMLFFLGGSIAGIGIMLKATSGISLIALCLVVFFLTPLERIRKIRMLLLSTAAVFCVFSVTEVFWNAFPGKELEEDFGAPVLYWVALGAVGNGGYGANEEFASACLQKQGKEAKRDFALAYMKEHWRETFSVSHLKEKMRYNFASGNMGLSDYVRDTQSRAYQYLNDYGRYGGYTTMLTSGYFYALLCYCILEGAALAAAKKAAGLTSLEILEEVGFLTLFGLVIFLMLWEANNRQLYNHMPWFALLGAIGCGRICEWVRTQLRM